MNNIQRKLLEIKALYIHIFFFWDSLDSKTNMVVFAHLLTDVLTSWFSIECFVIVETFAHLNVSAFVLKKRAFVSGVGANINTCFKAAE